MLTQWFESNQMQVNPSNCSLCIVMYSGVKSKPINQTIWNQVILRSNNMCYWAYKLIKKLSFSNRISTLWEPASQECNALERIALSIFNIASDVFSQSFIGARSVVSQLPWNLQEPRQHCYRGACQISKLYEHFNTRSRAFEALRDLTIKRLIRYWICPLVMLVLMLGYENEYIVSNAIYYHPDRTTVMFPMSALAAQSYSKPHRVLF